MKLKFKGSNEGPEKSKKSRQEICAKDFLGLNEELSKEFKYYSNPSEFAENFGELSASEQTHLANALDAMKRGYKITSFLNESVDNKGKEVYYLRFDKGENSAPVAKIVLDGAMRNFVNDVHDGKIKVSFDMEDIKKEFGQDN